MNASAAAHGAAYPDHDADAVRQENASLRAQLREARDTLIAIRSGDVDALVVGSEIYSLDSSHAATNRLRQDVLSQMDDAVLAFDSNENLVFMNLAAERLYGKTASQTLGRPKSEVFHESWSDDDARRAAAATLSAKGAFQWVLIHRMVDGTSAHVEARVSVLHDAGQRPAGQLYVVRNITDRVEAERALRDADRQKDEFLATLAHELRNPLAPIRHALQILRLAPGAEQQENARNVMDRQLRQLVRLVDDLLDISRISRGKVQLQRGVRDLNQIVLGAIETSRPLVDGGDHALQVTLPAAGTLMVDGDDTRLSQVVANLLNNAAKYTARRGSIAITASRQGQDAVLSVRDSGVGIAAEFQSKVFDLFTQIDRSMERSQGGLGIGLALVKRLVEMHGGDVRVHSDGPGLGSEFTVRLPLLDEPPASPAEVPVVVQVQQPQGQSGLRVLVVDDNVDGAETLAQVLDHSGHSTRTVHDGLEALIAAEDFRPHVIVLDIGLPNLNGHEVARHIRQRPWGQATLLLALSGWGQEQDRDKSMQAGFDRHFVKPVDLSELARTIADFRP